MSDKLQFVEGFGNRPFPQALDKLKPKSADKKLAKSISLNIQMNPLHGGMQKSRGA